MNVDRIAMSPCGPVRGHIRPPGSKSITNRALICAALAEGRSLLRGALESEDTQVMIEALEQLGVCVVHDTESRTIELDGCGGQFPRQQANLFLGNSGTSIRFLTAAVCLGRGEYRLDGVPRMRQRPIEDLLVALRQLGADARSETDSGCPPVVVAANGLEGGEAVVAGSISSQFLSGLLMAAPYARSAATLRVEGELVSKPYVDMTLAVMRVFGVELAADGYRPFTTAGGQHYQGRVYDIEPDASAASYFFAAAAISGGEVTVEGLSRQSLQGDVAFCECLAAMGCEVTYGETSIGVRGGALHGINVNMNAISDTVQTLAAVALFADGPTTIHGVGHIRHKETDRIGNLAIELRKLGATVDEFDDGLRIVPGPPRGAEIATYDDHRMAMSLALAGLKVPGIVILDPGCTRKTYPQFFADLQRLIGRSTR
jgi:3-phosphoshikimate 1-carboxyvinyltransferase